ncbi:MAG: hypothetical protein E4H03_02385 [Myxococcales bacterium]|nr:MAG: hypothetical protein E4H03_02385 [Myxococcales bacterium]
MRVHEIKQGVRRPSDAQDTTGKAAMIGRSVVVAATAAIVAFAGALPAAAQQETCIVEVRLAAVTCERSREDGRRKAAGSRGQYHVRVGGGAELGPFELRDGESSIYRPGILLHAVDTAVQVGQDGAEAWVPMLFDVQVREEDSLTGAEGGSDDWSAAVLIREHITCPESTTQVVRRVSIGDSSSREARRDAARLRLTLTLTARPSG